jgi:hypothetical protein
LKYYHLGNEPGRKVVFVKTVIIVVAAFTSFAVLLGIALSAPVDNMAGSTALGKWSTPVQVSTDEVFLIESCDQTLYAAGWNGLIVSPDEGANWGGSTAFEGTIDIDDYVLYRANFSTESYLDAYFSKSTDNGSGWSQYSHIMTYDGGSDGAYRIFKFDSVIIFYTYVEAGSSYGRINYSRSTDGGATWSPQDYIESYVHVEDPRAADIVLCGGKLFIAYYTYDATTDVVVKESDDMGATWTNRQIIGDGFLPVIREDSGNLYVTYWGNDGLMITMSGDLGVTWSTPLLIGPIQGYTDPSNFHSLAISGPEMFAAYIDYDVGGDPKYILHINYSDDFGNSWTDRGAVDGLGTNAILPSLLIADGKLHFMFIDGGPSGNWGGPTYYRWLNLGSPIPEFGIAFVPILTIVALIVLLKRRH